MWLVLFAGLVAVVVAEHPTSCPVGYKLYGSTLCLKFVPESLTFFGAVTACDVIDGKLLEIASPEDQQNVNSHLATADLQGARNLWLGGTDLKEEGSWLYLSHDNEEAMASWNNWAPSYPKADKSTNCAALDLANGWKWVSQPCTYHQPFLCYVRLRLPTMDPGNIVG